MRREVQAVLVALCSVIACEDTDKEASDSSADTANTPDSGVKDERDGGAQVDRDAAQVDRDAAQGDLDATQGSQGEGGEGAPNRLSFFVTSDSSPTGDLGGLLEADARCQRLAAAVGAGGRTWRAYLSAENSEAGGPIHARDRIGQGPWYNAKGDLVAQDLAALHARSGDAEIFLDENGEKINGQWEGSPTPNQHDILTGSDAEGRVAAGFTCADWTSAEATLAARVGHSDGLGPMRNGAPPYNSWQSSHESAGCNDTAPRGGAGKIYCFAAD